jgi:UDP-N-acetyl-D-mannosaminouronate:lipid I N-acetyl-D-mannosaminouronosyltransferase
MNKEIPNKKTVEVNGFKIFPFKSSSGFLEYINDGNWNNILVALNAEKIIKPDQSLRELVNCNIGYPDGVGAVYALKRKGVRSDKIPGSEFWLDIVGEFFQEKTFYLVGSKEVVIKQTVQKLKEQYPGINIVGYRNGYFEESEYPELLQQIKINQPDIVFVALGSPRQEYVMQDMKLHHNALYMGLGGSFDVYTGHVKRAPDFWINNHLEWAYRLIRQPGRIFRQVYLIKFVYQLLTNKI